MTIEPISVEGLLQQATGDTDEQRAIQIAAHLLERSQQLQTPQERRQQAELDRMIGQPEDKATLVEMTDQAFRTLTPARVADQLTHILDLQGVPRFFSPLEQTMLRGFQSFGAYLPGVAVPLVKHKMRSETANVILPAEDEMLTEHLRQRQRDGVRMNVNLLGEALLGEDAAKTRLQRYLQALKNPDVECISVKITTIYSQVSPLAREHTTRKVADRLELLYRAALRERFQLADGSETSKFVYLDMEEFRDLHLTVDAMCRALDRDELQQVRAGIALQAYIPDSFGVLEFLLRWSQTRVNAGRAPLTIRLVKGANMEMERVEASLGGWSQAPFTSKVETDANYKKMLRELLHSRHRDCVRVGVASHNLFDIALAMLWAQRSNVQSNVQYEMLEGMANHQRRAIFEASQSMLLYAPACRREEFLNAIGYLIRRLDENTGRENFLRHTFQLQVGTPEWHELADTFRESLGMVESVSVRTRRQQDRNLPAQPPEAAAHWSVYRGEPDTDWALPTHASWAQSIVDRWQSHCDDAAPFVPLVIDGRRAAEEDRLVRESFDPSRPGTVSCRYVEASEDDIEQAVSSASRDRTKWRQTSLSHRHELLRGAAQHLRERRADLIGAAMSDGGKVVMEADAEVSEAIDFTEFYPLTMAALNDRDSIQCRPRGVVAVVSPWNFPIAIPCGGVAAALAAGNTVILKPASDTVLPAYLVAQCFWDAGVPPEVLQLVPCSGARGGRRLIEDQRVETVILTGGTETARRMLSDRPGLHLIAETGGKNATIVTALSDRDLAIKHVLHSAFGHGGQKCSATSLLLLEAEVYEDANFRETLADAVRSLRVGSVWDLSNRIGPLIRPPRGELARGMKELEPGESWLVMPERPSANPQLFRPGVKWNVVPGGFTHATELFGPVLGVMQYRRLEDAIGIVNATGYGLTSGLESLDSREQDLWRQTIRAGNLYINRPTTGAIVLRQPFGGVGSSAYGPGVKAGGPHYLLPLLQTTENRNAHDAVSETNDSAEPDRLASWEQVIADQLARGNIQANSADRVQRLVNSLRPAINEEFGREHDTVQIIGQDNLRRYRAVPQVRVRIVRDDAESDVLLGVTAAVGVGSAVTVSFDAHETHAVFPALNALADAFPGCIEVLEESEAELASSILEGNVDRLRMLSRHAPNDTIHAACCEAFVSIICETPVDDGYIEGLRYLNEQSVSVDYHRYGNLGRRGQLD